MNADERGKGKVQSLRRQGGRHGNSFALSAAFIGVYRRIRFTA
jgi:hypothetical protein